MRALLRALSLLLVLAGFGYGGSVAWNSAQLELRRIEVAGNEEVAADSIASAPQLRRGDHLMRISTNAVETAVENIPWVKSARAERIIPSTIRITVVERVARGVVIAPNGPHLVDGERVVLETADASSGLVRIEGLPIKDIKPGDRIQTDVLSHIFGILQALDADLSEKVVAVDGPAVDRITLQMRDGWKLLYGALEDVEAKRFAIRALLEEAEREGVEIERLDVRVPSRPALKPR